jgi:hypothetical protein
MRANAALAAAHVRTGDAAAAEACLRDTVARAEAAGAGADAELADAAENLGVLCVQRGDGAGAQALLERAFALRRAALAAAAPRTTRADVERVRMLLGLARAHEREGGFMDAVVACDVARLLPLKD